MLDLCMQVEKVVLAWSFAQEKYLGLQGIYIRNVYMNEMEYVQDIMNIGCVQGIMNIGYVQEY